ncbi:MAG: hypothetical protein JO258_10760 [Alphaproteobacteria bacterium]|nr:hypothetical protein [Alphaproteobacteria bacterium]
MLADTVDETVKPEAAPKPATRRRAAPARGLIDRVKGWIAFHAVDGRTPARARGNAPFDAQSPRGLIAFALLPGVLLLVITFILSWNPISATPDVLSTVPIEPPLQTPVEKKLIQNIGVLREGIWEAKLPPWSDIPTKGMARVSNPDVHAALDKLFADMAAFGDTIGDSAVPGVHRDRVFLMQIADLRSRLRTIDAQLGGGRSITSYHLGLLALWAGDAVDAEPQFRTVVDIARNTESVDDEGQQRLDGIEAAAAYGLGLAEAGRSQGKAALGHFDQALTAACRVNRQADFGFTLGKANLVELDTRSIRNDRLVALLRARNAGDDAARNAIISPTCAQLLSVPANVPRGDVDDEARALFSTLSITGDPTLAVNLQLRAALMGERDVVQQLTVDDGSAELMQAQSLAHAIAGLEGAGDAAAGVDKSALADLQKISVLKARLAAQLRNATLAEPESDPSWTWSDPGLFVAWRNSTAAALARTLIGAADAATAENPSLAAALYGVVIDNRSWFPTVAVSDAWWRLNTGTSLAFVLWMIAIAGALSGLTLWFLWRWRRTYRATFESYHHDDRLRSPEG